MRGATLATIAAILAAPLVFADLPPTFAWGIGQGGLEAALASGWIPDLVQVWAGSWMRHGWDRFDAEVAEAAAVGATPVVEWYYWGDDIAPACLRRGCDGKSEAEWAALTTELARRLAANGVPAVVVVETEFNKGGTSHDAAFDAALAARIREIQREAPTAQVALGFGAWAPNDFAAFAGAMSEADAAGVQLVRAEGRGRSLLDSVGDLEAAVGALHDVFGKPILLHDAAISSFAGSECAQARALEALGARLPHLASLGLTGVVWREGTDDPARREGYFGPAEGAFGLRRADGSAKPASDVWRAMVAGAPTPDIAAACRAPTLPVPIGATLP